MADLESGKDGQDHSSVDVSEDLGESEVCPLQLGCIRGWAMVRELV